MAKRVGIMRPIPFDEAKFEAMPKPVIVQPKLEGDRARALPGSGQILSSSAKQRVSVPHIKKTLDEMGLCVETDGELFKLGMEHSKIRGIVSRTKNLHPDHMLMEYHIYDVVSEDSQKTRIEIQRKLPARGPVKLVPSFLCYSMDEFQLYYDQFLDLGYEGIIVRHPDRPYRRAQVQWMMKLKPRLSMIAIITDVFPLEDKYGDVHELMGAFELRDGDGRVFNVGSGPTLEDRGLFWQYRHAFIDTPCKIRFQGYTKARHVPKMQSIDKGWLKETRRKLRRL